MKEWIVLIVNYTLSLFMWLIIGRIVLSLFTSNRNNFMLDFFIRFTEPVYKVSRVIFPFARVSSEKEGTFWGNIEGCIAIFSIIIIVTLRILLVILFGSGAN